MNNVDESCLNSIVSKIHFFHERDKLGVFTVKSLEFPIYATEKSLDKAVDSLQQKIKNYLQHHNPLC